MADTPSTTQQVNASTKSPTGIRGAATAFQRNIYNVQSLMYPNDLLGPVQSDTTNYGGNYVVFYVNVHEDSYLIKDRKQPTVSAGIPPRQAGGLAGRQFTEGEIRVLAGGAGVAAASAAGAAQKVGRTVLGVNNATGGDTVRVDPLTGKVASAVGNAAIGVAASQIIVNELGGAAKQYKRLEAAIALHMPTELSIRYSAQWDPDKTAGAQAILEAASNIGDGQIKGAIGAGASYLAGAALKTPGAGSILSKSSGVAANPKKEQIFQEVDFRTFSFNYQFFPRSPEEARNVREIIKMFKLHMHPEYKPDSANFLFIYPSEFDIFYYQNGVENLNIHRHTSCVLTDMSVQYTPQGTFAAFDDGMPAQVNINLTFKELAILTKENIEDGF